MTAILPEHIEWATVDRMRQMLARPHQDFSVTGTLSLFTSILCWTMQRIRTEDDARDEIARRMSALSQSLTIQPFNNFIRTEPKPVLEVREGGIRTKIALNSLAEFVDKAQPLKAKRSLVALRNAVGHGDARRVVPLNIDERLIGFRFICTEAYRDDDGRWVEKWRGSICLDAGGMASIAGEIANQFCGALQAGKPDFEANAHGIRELSAR